MPLYELDGQAPEVPAEGEFWIAPDAHVIGRVTLGHEVGIWFGAVLRGDKAPIVLGARTNVQEGAMLHADPGFPLTVGGGTEVVTIGQRCLVGANALVTEGKEFPAGSLIVGAPAKAVRVLDEAAREGMRASAANYIANWRRFAAGMRRIG